MTKFAALALFALSLAAGAAHAAEATDADAAPGAAKTRAEVRAELAAVQTDGAMPVGLPVYDPLAPFAAPAAPAVAAQPEQPAPVLAAAR